MLFAQIPETTRKKLAALHGHSATVYALSFSADGHRLASAAGDGTIRMWDVALEP